MNGGVIHQLNVSDGGVPKRAVERARVGRLGLEGDTQAKPGIHGGPLRAVSLFALERIEALAAEGHPIVPGSTGENVTTAGLDWDAIDPGMRLHLGDEVVLEISSYATPCRTIAASFSDGRFSRLKDHGRSRLYAEVVREGTIARGDRIRIESTSRSPTMSTPAQLWYVNVYVSDLARSIAFFRDQLGLPLQYGDESFGYASFDAGPIRIGLAQVDVSDPDQAALVGRQTGVGLGVPDLKAAHAELAGHGVAFTMKPAKQPWGGFMAMFADPDGNTYYLDEMPAE